MISMPVEPGEATETILGLAAQAANIGVDSIAKIIAMLPASKVLCFIE
jgi:hypothetical protein